ncbi:MAG: NAD(P)H-binding protein [Pseudomonadota bacterium]
MKIGISGASGKLGKAVLNELATRVPAHKVIAISRTPEAVEGAAEARLGDYDNPGTLATAYASLDRLLIIPTSDLRPGRRGEQNLAAIDAAVAAGVGHIVLMSMAGTREELEPAIGASYWAGEQRLIATAARWTILRMNYYAESLVQEAQMSFGLGMLTGLAENRVAFVSRDDVAAAAAGILAGDNHAGAIYDATGPASISGAERAAMIAEASGRPMSFAVIADEQLRGGLAQAGLPIDVINAVSSIQAGFAAGGMNIVTGDVEKLSGRAPRPLQEILAAAF